MEPGIHQMKAELYHSDPAPMPSLSNSIIKVLLTKSPAHARLAHPILNPDHKSVDSDRFSLGTAAHSMLLEGIDDVVIVEADDWKTKDAKMQRDHARALGKTVLLRKHYVEASAMVGAAQAFIARMPMLSNVFAAGKPEQGLFWKEGEVWCRGLIDWLSDDRKIIVDYKTTSSNSPDDFIRSMGGFGYDTQAVFYTRGMQALGHDPEFYFLVQEDSEPYSCYLVQAAESLWDMGESKVKRGIAWWTECLTHDAWPGYPDMIYMAEAPAWALTKEYSK